MWSNVESDSDIEEAIEVLKAIDRNYTKLTLSTAKTYITSRQFYCYIYRSDSLRITLVIEPLTASTRLRVFTAGFDGTAPPQEAAEVTVAKLLAVMKEMGTHAILLTVRNVDSESMNQAVDIVKGDRRLRIRTRSNNGKYQLLEVTAADCSDKACLFEWTGTQWIKYSDDCKPGCQCIPPAQPGVYIGQQDLISCEAIPADS